MGVEAACWWGDRIQFEVGFRLFYRMVERPDQYRAWYEEFTTTSLFGEFVNPPSIQFIFDTLYSPLPSPITVPYGYILPGDEYFDLLDLINFPYRLEGSPIPDPFREARNMSVGIVIRQGRALQIAMQANKLTQFGRRGPH